MRCISIINQKGGVGKTTTTVNLAAALAKRGERVLTIDLDPQAHLTINFGHEPGRETVGIYSLLTEGTVADEVTLPVADNLWLIPSHIDLAAAEVELVSIVGREVLLRDALEPIAARYDYVLIDCPPSLGLLTINSLAASTEVFIPLQPHFLALQGLGKLLDETVRLVAKRINPQLRVTGIILTMYEGGARLAGEIVQDVTGFFNSMRDVDCAWSDARVFQTVIRRNIKLAEAPSHGLTIFDYAPKSNGAHDYQQLALEVLGVRLPTDRTDSAADETDPPDASATSKPHDPPATHQPAPVQSAAVQPADDTTVVPPADRDPSTPTPNIANIA